MKRKIVFFECEDWEKKVIKKALPNCDLIFYKDPFRSEMIPAIKNAYILSPFIYSFLDKKILSKFPKLKMIATRSTGFDHIDKEYCRRKKIMVCNVPHYGENTVAEHTFALILSLSRNIHKAYVRTTRQDFSLKGLRGFDLQDRTLGVVGTGRIGLHVIKMAKGFGMNVLACDVNQDKFISEILGFTYVTLEKLLKMSDIVSLHVPYNKGTHHLINEKNIKLMKKDSLLINTARGGVVDTDAIIQALDKKVLAGVGLDVLEGEMLFKDEEDIAFKEQSKEKLSTLIKNHILLHRENVVITPHIAFDSTEAVRRILDTTLENIKNFIAGNPKNEVNG